MMTTPPNRITGYRSKAINAVRDFAVATAPVAGAGLASSDTPGGRVLSLVGGEPPSVPRPWQVSVAFAATSSATGEWILRVHAGLATLGGRTLAAGAGDGTDTESGLSWFDVDRETFGADSGYLAVCADGHGGWTLRRKDYGVSAVSGKEWRAIAWIDWPADAAPKIRQLDLGVVDLGLKGGSGGSSGGDGEGEGEGEGESEGGDDDENTTPPSNPPPCGNPLNASDNRDPFDGDGAVDDRNPLDYEGDGGYTPICYGEEAA